MGVSVSVVTSTFTNKTSYFTVVLFPIKLTTFFFTDNDINNDADMTTACIEKNKGTGALFFSLSLFSDAVLMSKIVVRDIYPLTYYNKNRSKRVYQA